MNEKNFRELAIKAIVDYYANLHRVVAEDDVYVVWECKTLQNNKALLSTTIPDSMYYEFTWNGDKNQGYLDVYQKQANIVIDKE